MKENGEEPFTSDENWILNLREDYLKNTGLLQLEEFLEKEDEESEEEDIELEEAIEDYDAAEDADSESSDDEWVHLLISILKIYYLSNHKLRFYI